MLDADVVIRGEKGTFDLRNWLQGQPDERFEVAAITVAELWHGVERAVIPHKNKRIQYLLSMLAVLHVVPYTEQTAYHHARIWAVIEASGTMTGYYDLIVAATALEAGSQVATFNRRHFDCVPGLSVIEPK